MSAVIEETDRKPVNARDDSRPKILRTSCICIIVKLVHKHFALYFVYLLTGPAKTVLYEGLQEKDVGITEFTSSTAGISGILKHRLVKYEKFHYLKLDFYIPMHSRLSDFQVHEITLDDTVVHLKSRTVPEKEDEDSPTEGIHFKLEFLFQLDKSLL